MLMHEQPRLSLIVEDLKQENTELRANFDEVKYPQLVQSS